jgi:AcrR family transcriptional regulator
MSASSSKPVSSRRERREAEILGAAQAVFLEKGYEGSSVSEIAARVGLVEGAIYAYYPNKHELLTQVIGSLYEPLIEEVQEAYARLADLRGRLRFLVWRHIRLHLEMPGLVRLVGQERRRMGPQYYDSPLHGWNARYTRFVTLAMEDAMAQGQVLPSASPPMVRAMVYGGLETLLWKVVFGRERIDLEGTADAFTQMILAGVPAPAAPEAANTAVSAGLEDRVERLERAVQSLGGRPCAAAAAAARKTRSRSKAVER